MSSPMVMEKAAGLTQRLSGSINCSYFHCHITESRILFGDCLLRILFSGSLRCWLYDELLDALLCRKTCNESRD